MILVFKTSVNDQKDVLSLKPFLNQLLLPSAWNFDLEDCDKILRIDTLTADSEAVIALLQRKGFDCTELLN
jgi:hypothetical protein